MSKSIAIRNTTPPGKTPIYLSPMWKPRSLSSHEHTGEKTLPVNDFLPRRQAPAHHLDAANGYLNVALLDIATKKIDWLP